MKVLIVDDEEMIRNVLREYIEFEGNEAFEAADGIQAVKMCRDNDYDIILMDVMMPASRELLKFEGLEIDMQGRNVYVDGEKLDLTPKEYELLFYLVKNNGIALSREKLLSDVWGFDFYGDDRTVDTHIKMLRSSLKEYRKFIVTLRGLGYKFEA